MSEIESRTQSLLDIIKDIDSLGIMLPEFQRDFRWELGQTYDLFDSLIKDIFIGTIIYGKPSFSLTLREIDKRPRKGKDSNKPLKIHHYTEEQIKTNTQVNDLRIVLDGQQRITSLYRAITGIDSIYIILKEDLDVESVINSKPSLEDLFATVQSEEDANAISIKLSDVYDYETKSLEDEDLNSNFANSMHGKTILKDSDKAFIKANEKLYRQTVKKILDLYKQSKMVSYYLLDMDLAKFCTFFERSNSKGIQLNFTDILAAKLYNGFNLRKEIEEFESKIDFKLNREILIRAIAYIISSQEDDGSASIEKQYILKNLEAKDFETYWQSVCELYNRSLKYLIDNHFIVSQSWMSSENMIIPLIMYLKEIKHIENMNESQREFIEYWYWSSVFSNRYSGSSNEEIVMDCGILKGIVKGNKIPSSYFKKLRSKIVESEDLFGYTKKASAIYRGIFNLIAYEAKGTKDWNSSQAIKTSMQLEDHHIYPRAFINNSSSKFDTSETEHLVDCVVNRTLIPKITNIKIGKKSPTYYLAELARINSNLPECLSSHLIPCDIISDSKYNFSFKYFLDQRAKKIFELIDKYAIEPTEKMMTQYGIQSKETSKYKKPQVRELISMGKILIGDRLYLKKHPDKVAILVDSNTVSYQDRQIPINKWAQEIMGYSSINIYAYVILEKTGKTLNNLRQ